MDDFELDIFEPIGQTSEDLNIDLLVSDSTLNMNDIREENLGKRPLSKLTRDIYKELSITK